MVERTLGIVKPDGVARNLVGAVLTRIEETGLRIMGLKMVSMTREQAMAFYRMHHDRPFYSSLTEFMSSGPCVVMVLAGEGAIGRYRELMGATDPAQAREGTLRKKFATNVERNVVHGSDSETNAAVEIAYFFNALELTTMA